MFVTVITVLAVGVTDFHSLSMFNQICAPELSFNCGKMEPHAYVSFLDRAKASVPLHYILKFPTDWRSKGWDSSKLYHVFWSPNESESPMSLLQKVVEIPKFELGQGQEQAGYHRAAVLIVKGK